MKKRIITLLTALALILTLTACGQSATEVTDPLPAETDAENTLGALPDVTTNPPVTDGDVAVTDTGTQPIPDNADVSNNSGNTENNNANASGNNPVTSPPSTPSPPSPTTTSSAARTSPAPSSSSSAVPSTSATVSVSAASVDGYEEIYNLIRALQAENQSNRHYDDVFGVVEEADGAFNNAVPAATAPPASAPAPASGAGSDLAASEPMGETAADSVQGNSVYSDTNNQVAGVQESDIVKTDGKYIYSISRFFNSVVNITRADNGRMERIAVLELKDAYPHELLLYEDKLIVIWNKSTYYNNPRPMTITMDDGSAADIDVHYGSWWGGWHNNETIVEIYSINGDFKTPDSVYSQKGWFTSSRMINNNIYLITTFTPYVSYLNDFPREELELYIPSVEINGSVRLIAPERIILPERLDQIQYTVISGIDVNNANLLMSAAANLGYANIVYSSRNNIYITGNYYENVPSLANPNSFFHRHFTTINKFSLSRGHIHYIASGRVRGYVENQFWMDERGDVLRVVAHINEWGENRGGRYMAGALYALDANLNQLSVFNGIGMDENVQSVRFDGDIAYIVTFRLTDPLYAFDMSDPRNPVMLDELKIPGFSRYMHRWSDGLLLGVGVDADESDGVRTGLKVSMFDTSDNESLFERHVYIIDMPASGNRWGSWISCPAEHDHRAILVSPERNIIAFPYTTQAYMNNRYKTTNMYALFSYDKNAGFTLIGEITAEDSGGNNNFSEAFLRGLYIGDYIYAIAEDSIVSAKLRNAEIVQRLYF